MKTKKNYRFLIKKKTTKHKLNRCKKLPIKKRTKGNKKNLIKIIDHNEEKIVVFDLDETIGCFQSLYSLFYFINDYRKNNQLYPLSFFEKAKILDICPYFLRTNILSIFEKLGALQEKTPIRVVIFTNNTGGYDWPNFIRNYINFKLRKKIISQVIPIHKIDKTTYEPLRTSNDKKYYDLCRCLNVPSSTEVCFIDDREHEQMYNSNVHYIKPKEYKYFPNLNKLIEKINDIYNLNTVIPNLNLFMKIYEKNLLDRKIIDDGDLNLMYEILETEKIKTQILKYLFKKQNLTT